MTEAEAFVILSSIPGLGPAKIRCLLQQFGTAQNTLNATPQEISELPGFSKISANWNAWQSSLNWRHDLSASKDFGVQILPFTDPLYPKRLLEIVDPPVCLYVKGELLPQDKRGIAVVGTRNATIYGLESAESISRQLAAQGFTVVSGLARGIDTAAHQGALAQGRTIAVIGSGLGRIYPPENIALADKIEQHGAVISEYPMETPPDRQNFPKRNRIVSALSLGTLLIEAPIKSGAMITMDCASQQGKKLFALPGRADLDNFRGNHHLIKTGRAMLIENGDDIASHFDGWLPGTSPQSTPSSYSNLDQEELELLNLMPATEISIDQLSLQSSMPVHKVQRILMSLMLKKIIKEFPGKIYKATATGNAAKQSR